jgi:hypothetical protein
MKIMKIQKQNTKQESNSKIELALMRLLLAVLRTALLIVATVATAQAEPRRSSHHDNRNYIIRRQQAGLVSGVPTLRRIRGGREIDIYRNGLMFEKDNLVGVRAGSR